MASRFEKLSPAERLIVALDVGTLDEALALSDQLAGLVTTFKIGLQLFVAEGPQVVREMVARDRQVFLDLKLHDIPNTVAGAVRSAARLGASMLTVHTGGGLAMLKAAVAEAKQAPSPPMILGVTVLTSMDEAGLAGVGVPGKVRDQVMRLADLALEAGCDGIVASPLEARELSKRAGDKIALVIPGIRLEGADRGDQARTATAAEALGWGATHIVVGRPITQAADPATATRELLLTIPGAR